MIDNQENFNEDQSELDSETLQYMADVVKEYIAEGAKKMPLLPRIFKANEFLHGMLEKMPQNTPAALEKWKQEYALGNLQISFPEIYEEIQSYPEPMRGQMATVALEKQIMPAVKAEINQGLGRGALLWLSPVQRKAIDNLAKDDQSH